MRFLVDIFWNSIIYLCIRKSNAITEFTIFCVRFRSIAEHKRIQSLIAFDCIRFPNRSSSYVGQPEWIVVRTESQHLRKILGLFYFLLLLSIINYHFVIIKIVLNRPWRNGFDIWAFHNISTLETVFYHNYVNYHQTTGTWTIIWILATIICWWKFRWEWRIKKGGWNRANRLINVS